MPSPESLIPAPGRLGHAARCPAIILALVLGAVTNACGPAPEEGAGGAGASTTEPAEPDRSTDQAGHAGTGSGSPSVARAAADERPFPEAADGADLTACFDGTCEVLVESFPVEVPLDGSVGISYVTIESVQPDGVTFSNAEGGIVSTMSARVGGRSTFTQDDRELAITPVAVDDGAAVIRFTLDG